MIRSCTELLCVSGVSELSQTNTQRLFLVLHPRYKSTYFIKAKWPQNWISTAEDLLREHWEKDYKPTSNLSSPKPTVECSFTCLSMFSKTIQDEATTSKNKYFAEINSFGTLAITSEDPITEWLSSPPLVNVLDPIAWWASMQVAGHPLARMALDFLSAPGMPPAAAFLSFY
jgi:hypothetical protein